MDYLFSFTAIVGTNLLFAGLIYGCLSVKLTTHQDYKINISRLTYNKIYDSVVKQIIYDHLYKDMSQHTVHVSVDDDDIDDINADDVSGNNTSDNATVNSSTVNSSTNSQNNTSDHSETLNANKLTETPTKHQINTDVTNSNKNINHKTINKMEKETDQIQILFNEFESKQTVTKLTDADTVNTNNLHVTTDGSKYKTLQELDKWRVAKKNTTIPGMNMYNPDT